SVFGVVSVSKLINLPSFAQILVKRFKKIKIVLTRSLESVECIPYPREQSLKGW
ncbi:hypothetical protein VCHENC02_0254, partial [Vibrio harveyi]